MDYFAKDNCILHFKLQGNVTNISCEVRPLWTWVDFISGNVMLKRFHTLRPVSVERKNVCWHIVKQCIVCSDPWMYTMLQCIVLAETQTACTHTRYANKCEPSKDVLFVSCADVNTFFDFSDKSNTIWCKQWCSVDFNWISTLDKDIFSVQYCTKCAVLKGNYRVLKQRIIVV